MKHYVYTCDFCKKMFTFASRKKNVVLPKICKFCETSPEYLAAEKARKTRRRIEYAADRRAGYVEQFEQARASVREFAEHLAESNRPSWQLQSCDSVFETAARLDVLVEVVGAFLVGRAARDVVRELRSELLQLARTSVSRSTSQTSNLLEDARRVALARCLEDLSYLVIVEDEIVAA